MTSQLTITIKSIIIQDSKEEESCHTPASIMSNVSALGNGAEIPSKIREYGVGCSGGTTEYNYLVKS